MILHSLATITCDGAVHPLSAIKLNAKWVQVLTGPSNSGVIRIGGNEVSSTVGLPLPSGYAGQLLPPISELTEFYDLSLVNYYGANGDTFTILYGG